MTAVGSVATSRQARRIIGFAWVETLGSGPVDVEVFSVVEGIARIRRVDRKRTQLVPLRFLREYRQA